MSHSNIDSNRMWKMRFWKKGGCYSLVRAYNKAVPTQDSAHSA